jgi:predicted nucleotidyltransferase
VIDFEKIARDNRLSALAVVGSRARGDATRCSDWDLIGISGKPGFCRFRQNGFVVELHAVESVEDWRSKPSWWYSLSCLKVKKDDGTISTLPSLVETWRRSYQASEDEVRRNRDWLEAVVRKLRGSKSDMGTAFLLSTSLWEILSGAFIASNMPVPASSDMFRFAPEIVGRQSLERLLGGDLPERKRTALEMCRKTIRRHNQRLNGTARKLAAR